jgi:hypothetical protein
MPAALPAPVLTPLAGLAEQLLVQGWAVLEAAALCELAGVDLPALAAWQSHWSELPPDVHLRDGGHYRRRRHGCFQVSVSGVTASPHRPHWQPVAYNALHGGFQRWFEPLPASLSQDPAWLRLLQGLAGVADRLRGPRPWFVEAHPFRIDTAGGIGRPTPEGAHRDGVDLVVVVFVDRHQVKGGETRVFDAVGPQGVRFTLTQPFSALLLDDERVIHETTPIQPLDPAALGWRDTLVLTFRQGGFQGPEESDTPHD